MRLLREIRNPSRAWSIARRSRDRRFELFTSLLRGVERPLSLLDVGGTVQFWQTMGFVGEPGVRLTIANLENPPSAPPGVSLVQADARDLGVFRDGQFDVVFSNSVIEHVGKLCDQRAMAEEVKRVGRRYFVQTPNRFFPIEPHFMFPMFQFMPLGARRWLLMHFALAWSGRIRDPAKAESIARSVRLLSRREFASLFPGSVLWEERLFGLTKSFVCYGGW